MGNSTSSLGAGYKTRSLAISLCFVAYSNLFVSFRANEANLETEKYKISSGRSVGRREIKAAEKHKSTPKTPSISSRHPFPKRGPTHFPTLHAMQQLSEVN